MGNAGLFRDWAMGRKRKICRGRADGRVLQAMQKHGALFCRPGGVSAWDGAWSDELRGGSSGLMWGTVQAAVQRLALEGSEPLQCSRPLCIASV